MPTAYPTINGFAHEMNTARITANGKEYVGISSIDYDTELSPGEVRGTRAQLLARTRGSHKASSSMEMSKRDGQDFLDNLGDGYGGVVFDVVASYPGDPATSDMITDVVRGARITKVSQSASEGDEAIMMKFDLSVLDVHFGGKSIVPNSIY